MDNIIETIAIPVADYRKLVADLSYFKTKAKNRRKALKDLNVAQKHCNEIIRLQTDTLSDKTYELYRLREKHIWSKPQIFSFSKWLKCVLATEITL